LEKTLSPTYTSQQSTEQAGTDKDEHGDPLIRGFWAKRTDCILDVRIIDLVTDATSDCKRPPAKVLKPDEKKKETQIP
jgi:hypothetical protein